MPDSDKKRRTSAGKAGEEVLKEYNHRCAICGADRPQIHHIDENPSNQDPLNLLPLCPNCHLSDQHNPTVGIDPRRLRMFRVHRDPTILAPQFVPLFQRLTFLDDVGNRSQQELTDACEELVTFVAELEMGAFYARRLAELLKAPLTGNVMILPESAEDRYRRELREAEEIKEYRQQLTAAKPKVHALVVELLRYQHWRA